MIQTFKCKKPSCDKEVSFEYSPIDGVLKAKVSHKTTGSTETVYLTCDNGHTYPYEVEVSQ
jgi:hypothetical protein